MTPSTPLPAASSAPRLTRVVSLVFAAELLSLLVYSQSESITAGWLRVLFAATVFVLLVAPFVWRWLVRHEKIRLETELALRKSELKFRRLFEGSADALLVIDLQSNRFIDCNPAAAAMLGYAQRDELLNRHPAELSPRLQPDGQTSEAKAPVMIARAVEAGSHRFEWVHCSAHRSDFPVEVLLTPIQLEGQQLLMTTWRDLTARKQTEARIREQAEAIDKAPVAIIITDLTHRVTYCNEGATRLYGLTAEQLLRHTADELFTPETMRVLAPGRAATLATGAWRGEVPIETRDGRRFTAEFIMSLIRDGDNKPLHRLSIALDITEKKQMEEQLLRVQRLENLGLLAAGIAHDLNNILSPVLMAGPLLRNRATHPSDLRVLDAVEKSAERGSALVKQILSFARGVNAERVLLQARHTLLDVSQMIADTFPKSILVESHIPGDLWPVLSSTTQLHQVVLNLCINARDAMQKTGGTLTLSARNKTLAEAPDGLPAGNYLVIEVADTGSGMTPEVKARIWEPFFTTKAEGEGTGLGLATVRGIVAQHGGAVTVESAPGQGSVFRVYLPAAETGTARPETSNSRAPIAPAQHDELVLVIDDNADVRKLITLSLTQWGYRTLQAGDGAQAMELYKTHSADISLVVFDLDLPGQDGLSLARQLQGLRSDLRVLFITGVDSMKSFHLPPLPAGAPLLMKPFARHSLRKEIERALTAPVFAL